MSTPETLLFAYKFSCSYANQGTPVLAIWCVDRTRGRVEDVVHPADLDFTGEACADDADVAEALREILAGNPTPVHAVSDSRALHRLFWVTDNFVETDGSWYEYDSVFQGDDAHAALENAGIEVVFGAEKELTEALKMA